MSPSPYDDRESHVPQAWEDSVVLESLHCRKCGYDLRGLRAGGRCPECGFAIWESVQHTVDPAASHLPSIRNPRAVGNSLVILTACAFLGLLLMLLPSIGRLFDIKMASGHIGWIAHSELVRWLCIAAIGVAGLWAVRILAPPRGAEPHGAVWNDIWRIAAGFAGWIAFGSLWAEFIDVPGLTGLRQRFVLHLAAAVYATIGLIGLRGVFNVVGYRSREYRRSQGGRQSVDLVIAAVIAGFIGAAFAAMCHPAVGWMPLDWMNMARTIIWASNFMVFIGLAYLVMNAWWIRRSLRRPPPPIDQVLAPALPPDTSIPDREE